MTCQLLEQPKVLDKLVTKFSCRWLAANLAPSGAASIVYRLPISTTRALMVGSTLPTAVIQLLPRKQIHFAVQENIEQWPALAMPGMPDIVPAEIVRVSSLLAPILNSKWGVGGFTRIYGFFEALSVSCPGQQDDAGAIETIS